MNAVSQNVYFDVLDDIVDECNSTYHRTIKMKPIDVKSDSFAEYNEESNEKDPKFKGGDQNTKYRIQNTECRISKYKKNLLKAILQIGRKKFLSLKK